MSAQQTKNFDWVFNDVQFALDLGAARKAAGVTQKEVSAMMGHINVAGMIERATYTDSISMKDFLVLCNRFNLHAPEYFEIEPGDGTDITAGWEV